MVRRNSTESPPAAPPEINIDERRTVLEAQLAAASAEYDEAVTRAAADPKELGRLPPLRQRVVEITGAIADLKAVLSEVERAKERARAEEAAQRAAEERAACVRVALEHVAKYEAAGVELQRAIEMIGVAYRSFMEVTSAANGALYEVGLNGCVIRDIDDTLTRHLICTADLRKLPGLDEYPRIDSWPRPISERVRESCELFRRELAPPVEEAKKADEAARGGGQ